MYKFFDLILNNELRLNLINKLLHNLHILLLEVIYIELDDKLHQELCLNLDDIISVL